MDDSTESQSLGDCFVCLLNPVWQMVLTRSLWHPGRRSLEHAWILTALRCQGMDQPATCADGPLRWDGLHLALQGAVPGCISEACGPHQLPKQPLGPVAKPVQSSFFFCLFWDFFFPIAFSTNGEAEITQKV